MAQLPDRNLLRRKLERRNRGALRWVTSILLLLVAVGCGGGTGLTISTAASLGDAMEEIASEFERREGVEVDINLGGSNTLARQIELGAPVDLVMLAGMEPIEELVDGGHISRDAVAEVLLNSLVVIAKAGEDASLESLAELRTHYSGRISIADPQLAPAGAYTIQALEAAGLSDALEDRLIPALDVRAAAVTVESGNAEFGIVYKTDALAFDGVVEVFEIPAELHAQIVYPVAVVGGTDSAELAVRFLLFIQDEFSRRVFVSHGFAPIDGR